jgi:dihydroorotase
LVHNLVFRGGRLVDPASETDAPRDVRVGAGLILEVGTDLEAEDSEVIDITGAVICPGFVDMHTHLREPGREDEETIASGSAAAAAGGFTAICAMPNTDPVCDNSAVSDKIFAVGNLTGLTQVVPAGAITKGLEGKKMALIGEMAAGAAKVRIFTDDGRGVQNSGVLRRAMEYIKGFDAICAEHCEDSGLSEGGQMHEGYFSDLLGLKGIPAQAEEVHLARDLALAKLTAVRFHAMHLSTAGSVELIRRAKQEGLRVTAEVTPHHLSLTDAELASFDPVFKVNPPLRSAADVEALVRALVDGTIDAIATDHAPHSLEEKEGEFEGAPPGIIGLETALAVVLTELVERGEATLSQIVAAMSWRPARILGLPGQGGPVTEGAVANLTVFDPATEVVVNPEEFASRSRNCPWAGKTLKGRVLYTVFQGSAVVRDGVVVGPAFMGASG